MIKKKIFTGLIATSLTLSMFASSSAMATTNETLESNEFLQDTPIETAEELIDTMKELSEDPTVLSLGNEEKLEVLESVFEATTEEAQEDYDQKIATEIEEVTEQVNELEEDFTGYYSNEVTLSNGSEVLFEATDFSEEDFALQGMLLSPDVHATKDYGARKFTATVTFTSFGIKVGKIALGTHYTIGSTGLVMRYASKAGTASWVRPFDIVSADVKVTDSKAEKVGYDINAEGDYTVKGMAGVFSGTKYMELKSTVKLATLDKVGKKARVNQSYNFLQ